MLEGFIESEGLIAAMLAIEEYGSWPGSACMGEIPADPPALKPPPPIISIVPKAEKRLEGSMVVVVEF